MIHVYRICPHCSKRIKLTKYSWDRIHAFICPHCGTRLVKRHHKWGGIFGYRLECE